MMTIATAVAAFAPALAQNSSPDFIQFITARSKASAAPASTTPPNIATGALACAQSSDLLEQRVLLEYGAIFAAAESVTLPGKCIYKNADEVNAHQKLLKVSTAYVSGVEIQLQEPAMRALVAAESEAIQSERSISPLDGVIAGKRSYADSVRIWNKRFFPALDYWVESGAISFDASVAVRNMPLIDQSRQVMLWEENSYFFGTGRKKSIFASTAPPGASHHLTLLAFDVAEYHDMQLTAILNSHGWYQTVVDDPPHFTYLGKKAAELPSRGLKQVTFKGYSYWIPNITPTSN